MDILKDVPRQPQSVDETYTALDLVGTRLAAQGDRRAAFPKIYGMITRAVADAVAQTPSPFLEPRWMSRLAGRFGERYLDTLSWSLDRVPQDCTAWRIAYRYADERATIPLQDVILGLSAHINYDLTLGIAQTIEEHGEANNSRMLARYKHDHDHVNTILDRSIPEAYEVVVNTFGCRTTSLLTGPWFPLVHRGTLKVLAVWREQVWRDVLALLASHGDERERVRQRLERRSGLFGHALVLGSDAYLAGKPLLAEPTRQRLGRWLIQPAMTASSRFATA